MDIILSRLLIAERKRIPFPYIQRPLMSGLLLRNFDNSRFDDNPLMSALRRIAESIISIFHGKHIELPKEGIKSILCTAAVNHLGSRGAGHLMALQSYGQTQTTHGTDDLLTAAALLGNIKVLEAVLFTGVEITSVSKYLGTPLQAAAAQGHLEMVLYLLKRGVDGNYVCGDDVLFGRESFSDKGTALRSASRRDRRMIVRILLWPAYNLKCSGTDYENAVIDAAYAGHTDMVKFLLEMGTFPYKSKMLYEILETACRFGHIRLVSNMLAEGLNIQGGGSRALESAAHFGHGQVVRLLSKKGCNPSYDYIHHSAIHAAARNGHQEIVQMLLDKGVDVNSDGFLRLTPLFQAAKTQQLSMMRFLLKNGADLQVGRCGDAAFFRAVNLGHEQVVRLLAEAGVSVDGVPDGLDPPPIVNAMIHGQEKMIQLLLELGARWVNFRTSVWAKKYKIVTHPLLQSPKPLLKA